MQIYNLPPFSSVIYSMCWYKASVLTHLANNYANLLRQKNIYKENTISEEWAREEGRNK